ncbi:MAG: C40 family peptidase [Chitinophagaceae bacterium]
MKLPYDDRDLFALKEQFVKGNYPDNTHIIFQSGCLLEDTIKGIHLPIGSQLSQAQLKDVRLNGVEVDKGAFASQITSRLSMQVLQKILFGFIGVPYHWGALSVFGIDCSGLVKIFFKCLNMHLPHQASKQFEMGDTIHFMQEVEFGDLAFFESSEYDIYHVGIMLNENEIIHASESNGEVAVDYIDQEGIILKKSGKRISKLKVIKRIF